MRMMYVSALPVNCVTLLLLLCRFCHPFQDPRYNSVRSHTTAAYHQAAFGSPSARSEPDHPDTTVYDLAQDESFATRQRINSSSKPQIPPQPPLPVLIDSSDKKPPSLANNSGSAESQPISLNAINSHKAPSSTVSANGTEIEKLKSQLSAAQKEVEKLKALLKQSDEGLRRRTHQTSSNHSLVNGADMMTLGVHGLKGPSGLVPVQTVVLISIGVFAFTWCVESD